MTGVIGLFIKSQKNQRDLFLARTIEYRRGQMASESNELIIQMHQVLDTLILINDTAKLVERALEFGSDYDFNFFVDSLNGVVVANRKRDKIGRNHKDWDGLLWQREFLGLVNRLRPDTLTVSTYRGLSTIDSRGDRYGVFYKDTERQLLFGLVVTDDYLIEKSKPELEELESYILLSYTMVGIHVLLTFGLLLALWFILRLAEARKHHIEKNKILIDREVEYNRIIDSSHSAIAVMDIQSRVLRVNSTFDTWYGSGYLDKLMIKESSHPSFGNLFAECLAEGRATYYNSGSRSGRLRASLISLSIADLGEVKKIVFVGSDVTEHTLIRRAVGHELKTPISKIIGALDIISKSYENKVPAMVDMAYGITQQLLTQVESLEQWAGIHYNQVTFFRTKIDVAKTLETIINDRYYSLLRYSKVKLTCSIESDLSIEMTPGHLDLILLNILSNAIKALSKSKKSNKKINIAASQSDDFVIITIQDSGPGMDIETQQTLYQGNGRFNSLGSDLVAHFVQGNKGKIFIESSKVQGTTITLKFYYYAL
jgi:hypothetical protein